MACEVPITEAVAQSLYGHLLAAQGSDGCTLDEVATEHTQMTVVWKRQGSPLPAAEIVGKDCAATGALVGPTLAMSVPESLRSACPTTVQNAIRIVQSESFGALSTPGTLRPLAVAGGVVAVAAALFTVVMVLRHRPGAASPRP